jgi:hypothetical protein
VLQNLLLCHELASGHTSAGNAERLAGYPLCQDAKPIKLEGDFLGHGGYIAAELSR